MWLPFTSMQNLVSVAAVQAKLLGCPVNYGQHVAAYSMFKRVHAPVRSVMCPQAFSTSPRKTQKAMLQSQLCSNARALEDVAEHERKAVAYAAESLRHKARSLMVSDCCRRAHS